MKMITAIINRKDTLRVCDALTESQFEFTKLATTGGFLKAGNTTLMIGVDDDKLDDAIALIRQNCAKRMERVPAVPATEMTPMMYNAYPAEVLVGGAIVFVTEVTHFEKM